MTDAEKEAWIGRYNATVPDDPKKVGEPEPVLDYATPRSQDEKLPQVKPDAVYRIIALVIAFPMTGIGLFFLIGGIAYLPSAFADIPIDRPNHIFQLLMFIVLGLFMTAIGLRWIAGGTKRLFKR